MVILIFQIRLLRSIKMAYGLSVYFPRLFVEVHGLPVETHGKPVDVLCLLVGLQEYLKGFRQ
jgi:hypothetical protein